MITDRRFFPEVIQVVPGKDRHILVYFNDGSVRDFDVEPLLAGEVFRPLRDGDIFRKKLTVLNRTVAWDLRGDRNPAECIDLDPLVIYRSPCAVFE